MGRIPENKLLTRIGKKGEGVEHVLKGLISYVYLGFLTNLNIVDVLANFLGQILFPQAVPHEAAPLQGLLRIAPSNPQTI